MAVDGGDIGLFYFLPSYLSWAWAWAWAISHPIGQLQEQSVPEVVKGVLQSTGLLLLVAGALLLIVILLRVAIQMDALPKAPTRQSLGTNEKNNQLSKVSKVFIDLKPQYDQSVNIYWNIPVSVAKTLPNDNNRQHVIIRLLDVTYIDLAHQPPHATYDYPQLWNESDISQVISVSVPEGDRDYIAELGYRTPEGQWHQLTRSNHVRVPKA